MYILAVNERDVFRHVVITLQHLHKVLLDLCRLFHNVVIGITNAGVEAPFPLRIRELVLVQFLQPFTKIGN